MEFEFDAWSELARFSPEEFERKRCNAIDDLIVRTSNPCRLRQLQWRIDAERRQALTPMKACLKLSSLMWVTFFEFRKVLNSPSPDFHAAKERNPAHRAKVIPIRPRRCSGNSR